MNQEISAPNVSAQYPLLGDRIQSTFIDTMLMVILMFVFAEILEHFDNVPDWVRIVLFISLWGVYEPLGTTLGCTLGNYIKNIRVRQAGDPEERINFFQALLRYALKILLGWLSFLTIHSNKERRAIHDFAAGSVMIRI